MAVLVVRILTACNTKVICTDSLHFLEMADLIKPFRLDFFSGVNHHVFHPLFPILMAAVRDALHVQLDLAGQIVSVTFGTLCVIPLFAITRRLFGVIPALCAAALFTVHPESVKSAADVMSEQTYLFFVLSSVALAIPVITRRSWGYGIASGMSAGFAYLTRPEGCAPLIVLVVFLLASMRNGFKLPAKCIVVAIFGFVIVASPYMKYISFIDGEFKPEITLKKPLWHHKVVDGPVTRDIVVAPNAEYFPKTGNNNLPVMLFKVVNKYREYIFYFILPFVLLGAALSFIYRNRLGPATGFVVGVMAITIGVAMLLLYKVNYLSHRHIVTFTALTITWGGYGLGHAALWLRNKIGKQLVSQHVAVVLLCVIVMAAHIPKISRMPHWSQIGAKSVARVIKEKNLQEDEYVITNVNQVLYYAGIKNSNRVKIGDPSKLTYNEIMRINKELDNRVKFMVIQYKRGFQKFIDSGEYDKFALIYTFDQEQLRLDYGITRKLKDKRKTYVYEIPKTWPEISPNPPEKTDDEMWKLH